MCIFLSVFSFFLILHLLRIKLYINITQAQTIPF